MIFIAILYAFLCFFLIINWFLIDTRNQKKIQKKKNLVLTNNIDEYKVSVIVAARNEEKNILYLLESLENQTFKKKDFEVIIIDDNSEDNTTKIIKDFQKNSLLSIKILQSDKKIDYSPKKKALTLGINQAKGILILTTDADCIADENWIKTIWDFYKKTEAKLISSPVTFHQPSTFFEHFQVVDFASLVASGAISLSLNVPNMANGANLAYTRSVFLAIEGYQNTPTIASGDDEFLLAKIANQFPNDVYFLKDKNAIIITKSSSNWNEFYKQRKRWASKWKYYKDLKTKILAFVVFLFNFNVLLSIILFCSNLLSFYSFCWIIGLKFIPEFLFLMIILLFFEHKKSIFFIFLIQIIYPFYVLLFAFAGFGKEYEWKGRKLS
ncbi:MAG: glycosyltransferase [Cytophagia bacterium]|nr:MAG: glycosyltransferase [Cytophagia bacterium]